MARILTCIDPVPVQDGSCTQTAWLDQSSWVDMLPTVQQANTVGPAIFVGFVTLAALRLIIPKEGKEE